MGMYTVLLASSSAARWMQAVVRVTVVPFPLALVPGTVAVMVTGLPVFCWPVRILSALRRKVLSPLLEFFCTDTTYIVLVAESMTGVEVTPCQG